MLIRRLLSALLCFILFFLSSALAEGEEAQPAALPVSRSLRTESGVTVSGTRAAVDFDTVRAINPDTVGWLYQEETLLSYPVMQNHDKIDYQSRGFDGARLSAKGSVALEKDCTLSGSVIYLQGIGRDGSCFASLNEYDDQAYYDAHPSLRLITPEGDWQVDLFAFAVSKQNDNDSWRAPLDAKERKTWLDSILEHSPIQPLKAHLPHEDERLMVLVINNKSPRRNVVFGVLRPITYETDSEYDLVKGSLDQVQSGNGVAQVGPLGSMMVYAQNDPIWDRMRYESSRNSTYRVFGGGGCGPTAAAIAIANLVPAERLPELAALSKDGLGTLMCSCSVNRVYCTHIHVPYRIQTAEEYLRYLPVVMADLAAGNNIWNQLWRRSGSSGSSIGFLDYVCDLFGLERINVKNLTEGLELLKGKAGRGLLVCTALRKSPFTNSSHFAVIAGVDEEYFYVLDSLRRDDYASTDLRNILELLSPGVTRIRLDRSGISDLTPVYYIERKDVAADVAVFSFEP